MPVTDLPEALEAQLPLEGVAHQPLGHLTKPVACVQRQPGAERELVEREALPRGQLRRAHHLVFVGELPEVLHRILMLYRADGQKSPFKRHNPCEPLGIYMHT